MAAGRLPILRSREVVRVLQRLGFYHSRQVGSHALYVHPDGRTTAVPIHGGKDIGRGLLQQILREINMSQDEFSEYL